MFELKITTLTEDTSNQRGLLAEHGLSFLIEYNNHKILFDTGQGPSATANAKMLGIDFKELDFIVLSHGHYDHSGGLYSILRKSGPLDIYAHPNALEQKYKLLPPRSYRATGLPDPVQELKNSGAHFKLNHETTEIIPGLFLTGEIPRLTKYETVNPSHYVERDGSYIPDPMPDDQAMVVETKNGPVIITGCAHAGVVNTLRYGAKICGTDYIYALVGGTHLYEASTEQVDQTIEELKQLKAKKIATCHCTGFKAQMAIYQTFGDDFITNNTGSILHF
ncbi:MAG: MBL fold metallo-hydrolase [Firmicutes bacterium]|nr:MBL fold metallo-hydrolase [Bacillota bacterium]